MRIAKPSFEAVQLPVGGLAFHHRFDPVQPFLIKWRLVKRIAVSGAGEAAHDAIFGRIGARAEDAGNAPPALQARPRTGSQTPPGRARIAQCASSERAG